MEALLASWGMDEEVIGIFKDNKIELDDLILLGDKDLEVLVPYIGPRNRIRNRIQLMMKERQSRADNSGSTSSRSAEGPFVITQLSNSQQKLLSDIVHDNEENLENDSDDECLAEFVRREKPRNVLDSSDSGHGNNESESSTPVTPTIPAAASKKAEWKRSRQTFDEEEQSSDNFDLHAVITSAGSVGEALLNLYSQKKLLNDRNRSVLSKIIISKETSGNLDKRLSKERAKFIASQIVQLFPTELLSTWYRVEMRPNGTGKIVKGRLMRRFYTQRSQFKKLGLLFSNSDSEEEEEEEDSALFGSDEEAPDNVLQSMLWLENKNISPWTRVLSAWSATSKRRLRDLQRPVLVEIDQSGTNSNPSTKKNRKKVKTSNLKVSTYTSKYPQILEPQGWTLLEIDFEIYQKDSLMKLDVEYAKLEEFILRKLKDLNKDILFDDFKDKSKCERSAYVFLHFSNLFPVKTLKSAAGSHWRPSRQEMRDSFLLHVKGYGDMKTLLDARRLKLEKFNLSDQPLPIIIGQSINKISKSYVKFDSCEYQVESPMKAVDIAFKSYHALHATYPAESEPMWLFLQKGIYKFNSKWDSHHDAVETLLKEYNNFKL